MSNHNYIDGVDKTKSVRSGRYIYAAMQSWEKHSHPPETIHTAQLLEERLQARSYLRHALTRKVKTHIQFWTKRLQDVTTELKKRGHA